MSLHSKAQTKIVYYITPSGKNVIREFILSLQKQQQAKVRRTLQLISEYGLTSANPHIKKLAGTPFWETCLPAGSYFSHK